MNRLNLHRLAAIVGAQGMMRDLFGWKPRYISDEQHAAMKSRRKLTGASRRRNRR